MFSDKFLKSFGQRAKQLQEEKNFSPIDLTVKIKENIDALSISRIENGRTNTTLITLYRLSEALVIEISELLNFTHSKEVD